MTHTTLSSSQIILTDSAVAQLRHVLPHEASGAFLRVAVSGGGCAGFQYHLTYDTHIQSDDIVVHCDDVRVVIDAISYPLLQGSTIDYKHEGLMGSSFVVRNPNTQTACGCGNSFSI